jgi:uncharacterized protein (TIGR03067 family)
MTAAVLLGTEAEVRADLEALQGAWVSVAGRRVADLLIAGRLFAISFRGGELYMGSFELNPAASPKAMDMRVGEGPARHRDKVALCIYELEGDKLRWSPGEPGEGERPACFSAPDDRRQLSLVFRRQRL